MFPVNVVRMLAAHTLSANTGRRRQLMSGGGGEEYARGLQNLKINPFTTGYQYHKDQKMIKTWFCWGWGLAPRWKFKL